MRAQIRLPVKALSLARTAVGMGTGRRLARAAGTASSASVRAASRPTLPTPHTVRQPRHYTTATASLKSCPSCGETQPLESLSCPSCSTLQPLPSDIDFYKIFDLDLSTVSRGGWDVDEAALKRTWRLRMGLTHPDRMSGRSEKEQQIGAQQSALINRAYETLLHPLSRAVYLLERYGVKEVGEADSLEDPELLMEVMELRERLEEAESEEEAAEVRAENKGFLDDAVETLAKAFGSHPPDLDSARKAAVELRYWTNIDKAAREWSPGKRVEIQH